MTSVLLDTHVLIWLLAEDATLGQEARLSANTAATGGALLVSAISFWEVAMLARRNRLTLTQPAAIWRQNALAKGIIEVPISGDVGVLAADLADLHRDPADRFIVATSIVSNAVLLTADAKLLDWEGVLERRDARR